MLQGVIVQQELYSRSADMTAQTTPVCVGGGGQWARVLWVEENTGGWGEGGHADLLHKHAPILNMHTNCNLDV